MFSKEKFAERLKSLRIKHKMTQKEFAEKIGITPATLSAYENQTNTPPLSVLVDIAEYANLSIDWLCGLSDIVKSGEFVNLGEVVGALVEISKKIDTKMFKTTYEFNFLGEPLESECIAMLYNNTVVNSFLEDWVKIKDLYDKKTIDDELYGAWIEKKIKELSSYDSKVLRNLQPTDEDLPF